MCHTLDKNKSCHTTSGKKTIMYHTRVYLNLRFINFIFLNHVNILIFFVLVNILL